MSKKFAALGLLLCAWLSPAPTSAQDKIPKAWDDAALAEWATPLAAISQRPGHFSEREYYAAPVDNLRSYPVYHPDREPAGYWDALQKKKPEVLIEIGKTRTQQDWIRDGKRVFEELDVPIFRTNDPKWIAKYRAKESLEAGGAKPLADGTMRGLRWVVTKRGVEIGFQECAGCHTRVMAGGIPVHGPGFNDAGQPMVGERFTELNSVIFPGDSPGMALYRQFGVPWLKSDPHEKMKTMSEAEGNLMFAGVVPGVFPRFNGSPIWLTKVPDLIGIKDRKYIDHTATHKHRGPGDIMRYAALVTSAESADFGAHRLLTDQQRTILFRYPDEALYALAMYIYALEPPTNPYKADSRVKAGQAIFQREGCAGCHTPPFYTNNKVTVATGFKPPKEHQSFLDILNLSVGTDPNLALNTRKGTGYYKVPSLKGVWYRGLYLHDGSIATLEDLFDARRLEPTFVPTGSRGFPPAPQPVTGHEFGLKLNPEARANLIAFLRSL